MLTVSNTSPVSNLASIGRLELLKSQFSVIWIPDAVAVELAAHPDPDARDAIQSAVRDRWIRIGTPHDSRLLRVLMLQLHQGEARPSHWQQILKPTLCSSTNKKPANSASRTGLAVTGVLGILLRAKRDGHITKIKPEIDLLRAKSRFFVAASLEAKVLSAAGE